MRVNALPKITTSATGISNIDFFLSSVDGIQY